MQDGDLAALITAILIVPAAMLITANTRLARSYRLLSAALLFLGLAKLVRVRFIFDVYIEPVLADVFWAHNLPVAIAAACAVVSYTLVAVTLSAFRRTKCLVIALASVSVAVFMSLFFVSYGDSFRPYLSGGGVDSPVQAATWAIPLLYVGIASISITILGVKSRIEGSSSLGTKLIGDSLVIMGFFGIVYFFTKGGYVVVSTLDNESSVLPLLARVGLVSFPASCLFLALSVFIPGGIRILDRIRRYTYLKKEGLQGSPLAIWSISASEEETHRAFIEHSDNSIIGRPHTTK